MTKNTEYTSLKHQIIKQRQDQDLKKMLISYAGDEYIVIESKGETMSVSGSELAILRVSRKLHVMLGIEVEAISSTIGDDLYPVWTLEFFIKQ